MRGAGLVGGAEAATPRPAGILRPLHHLGCRSTSYRSGSWGYIESLLDSAGISLNDATRSALGRSVSMDRLLPIDEASDLINYLKEHPGDLQGAATHRRHPANRGPNAAPVLRPLLNRPDVLVIDVETTGLG